MTISQFEAEPVQRSDIQGVISDETSTGSSSLSSSLQSKRNPPARNTSRFWFERFLSVIQRQNPSIIDSSFLAQIAPSNEGKLLAQLKFLGVIDEQGKPTKLLAKLNMVGEEQKLAFQEIAGEAYRDLQSEIKIEKAVPDDLVNFFIRKYAFTRDKAINAAKFYLYLVEKSGSPVSNDLRSLLSEKLPGTSQPGSASVSVPRVAEKPSGRSQGKDLRMTGLSYRQNQQRRLLLQEFENHSPIQAVINIKLEKDTPREYWDRVLALLGERQRSETAAESSNDQNGSAAQENFEQEASGDSAFT
jgi:hypothetical protein